MARYSRPAPVKPAIDLAELCTKFHSEAACHAYLADLRWPEGVRCPRCESASISKIASRHQYDCNSCRYQFSVRVGTIFADSHLPLWKWFMATFLLCEAKKSMSSLQLSRTLGITGKTAWYLTHRIRAAMSEASPALLSGVVEADETWIGGKLRNQRGAAAKAARTEKGAGKAGGNPRDWRRNKTLVLGAVERGGDVRLRVANDNRRVTVEAFLADVVADDVTAIYTDELHSYDHLGNSNTVHESVNHFAEEWVRGDVHTNTVELAWSLFKRSIIGSFHQLSAKHLDAYLDEFEWRFNNRQNPFLFRDTVLRLLAADTLRYKELIA